MPDTSDKILKMFSVKEISLNSLKDFTIANDTVVTKDKENLFVRLELKDIEAKMEQ